MKHSQLAEEYLNGMNNHPYGIALYHPLSTTIFQPSSCGYFDNMGDWNPIVQLHDPASLAAEGFTPLREELKKAPTDVSMTWGPKVSEHTKASKVDMSVGIDGTATGIPFGASAVYSFGSDSSTGAVLLTTPPIVHERFYYESPFKNWVKENVAKILQRRPEVETYGMWIVTSTYSTKLCAINAWKQAGKHIKVGFKVNAVGAGELGPSGQWFEDQEDQGWSRFEGSEPDEKMVVFFGGLKFRYSKFFKAESLKSTPPVMMPRGKEHIVTKHEVLLELDENHMLAVDCEDNMEKEVEE